jgi:hypothetical protein
MKNHTHEDLVVIAARWLQNHHRCGLVITEMGSGCAECPDAIGWIAGGMSHLVECKTSRADFLVDRDKWFRSEDVGKMFAAGNFRWYLTPPGLVQPCEIKGQWGLLEIHGRSVREIVAAHAYHDERRHEVVLLTSAVRRMANIPGVEGIRCRVYNERGIGEPRATVYAQSLPPNSAGHGTGATKAPGTGRATRPTLCTGKPAAAHPHNRK